MKPEVPPKNGTRRYAVFLSYRHADNKEPGRQWATWLHQMLETYEIPSDLAGATNARGEVIPASLYPVFRDEEELPADADLTRNIRQALENSEVLAVICSPRAVQSRFVAEEIRYFKELGKADRIIAVMIDGEPNTTDDAAKQSAGLTAEMECLPEPLRRGVAGDDERIDWNLRTEPIAADARPGGQPVQGWTTSAAYREELLREGRTEKSNLASEIKSYEQRLELTKLKVVAGAIGVPLGVLTQRDKAMQLEKARKRARTLRRWLAVVALLAVLAIVGGVWALKKQREAARERDAKEQARSEEAKQRTLAQEQSERRRQLLVEAARSDRLVAEDELGKGELPAGFAHLARSIVYDPTSTFAAEKAIAALNTWNFPTARVCEHNIIEMGAEFSADSKRILIYGLARDSVEESAVVLADASSGQVLTSFPGGGAEHFIKAHFSPDGKLIVFPSSDNTAIISDGQNGTTVMTLRGHSDDVYSAQFSPDGKLILTIAKDKTARIWDARNGKTMGVLRGLEGQVANAEFSPDGMRVATSSGDKTVRLWDAQTGKPVATLSGQEIAHFSFDGKYVVTSSPDSPDREAHVWVASSGKHLQSLKGHEGSVFRALFSPNSQYMLTICDDAGSQDPNSRSIARIWNAHDGKPVAVLQAQAIGEFSADSALVVTAGGEFGEDTDARVWDSQTGKLRAVLHGNEKSVLTVHFSPNSHRVVTLSNDDVTRIFNLEPGGLVRSLPGRAGADRRWAKFSPDGKRVVTAEDYREKAIWRVSVRVWETENRKPLMALTDQPISSETRLCPPLISPDGDRIVTAVDSRVQIWDAMTGKLLDSVAGDHVFSDVEFSPDGQRLLTAGGNVVRVWDVQSGKEILTLDDGGSSARFSPDGHRILTTGIGNAQLWDADTGQLIHTLDRQDFRASIARFSADGKRIGIAWNNNIVQVWDNATGTLVAELQGEHRKFVDSLELSRDGERVLTADDNMVRVWDANTGNLLTDVEGGLEAHFSPDEQRVVTLGGKAAKICDAKSGRVIASLYHDSYVRSAEFSRDGQHILTTSDDNTPRIWTILPPSAGVQPSWFVDFLFYMAQKRLNSNGELEFIPPSEWLAIRERLRKVVSETATKDTSYLRILRHFVHE